MTPQRSILVVDDSPDTRRSIEQALDAGSWRVEYTKGAGTAEQLLAREHFDVLVTSLGTAPGNDVRTLRRIRRYHPKAKVIVLADCHAPDNVVESLKASAFSYFSKPFSASDLREMVERALAEPDWDDGIEVLSDKPDWISIRASCRQLTADRLLNFLDELTCDLPEEDRKNTGAAFREILMNAIEHGGQFDPDRRVDITRVRTAGMLMYLIRDPGEGFDPADLPHAAISNPDDPMQHILYRDAHGMRAGGFGLLAAKGFVDDLVHNSKGNEAVLIKYLK